MQDFARTILNNTRFKKYAIKLTTKEDGEDILSDIILKVLEKPAAFQTAHEGGYFNQFIYRCIYNAAMTVYRDSRHEIKIESEAPPELTFHEECVLDKVNSDMKSNSYYPLVFRETLEHGVQGLAEKTDISRRTLSHGAKVYKDSVASLKKVLIICNVNTQNKEQLQVGPVSYHRLLGPWSALRDSRNDIHLTVSNSYVAKDFDYAIFNRVITGSLNSDEDLSIIREMKVRGTKVIVDIDDYWNLPTGHYLENHYQRDKLPQRITENIKAADMVICTNDILAFQVLKLNKNVVVIPNGLNPNQTQWQRAPEKCPYYRIGYAAGLSHKNDYPLLIRPIEMMYRKHSGFQMVLANYDERYAGDWEPYIRCFTNNETAEYGQFNLIKSLDTNNYGRVYNYMDCALAPLADNLFNRCKSNLKVIEAAAHGIPIIASKIHPYYGAEFDECTIFADDNNWYKKMKWVLGNPEKAAELGKEARKIFLKHYTLAKLNKLRSEIL